MNENFNGFRMPAEWEPQNSVWIAWPYNKNDWPGLYQFIPEVILKIIKLMVLLSLKKLFNLPRNMNKIVIIS